MMTGLRLKKPTRFWILLCLLVAVVIGALVLFLALWNPRPKHCIPPTLEPSNLFTRSNLADNYEPYGYVAHAFGEVDGNQYTNTREAFLLSYQKGFRIFEVDLVLLGDGTVFCAHDGLEDEYGIGKPFYKATHDELSGSLYLGKYTTLDGPALLDLVYAYSDAYFILDTKWAHSEILSCLVSEAKRMYPSHYSVVLDRVVPHISGAAELDRATTIYPFKDYMFALYRATSCPDTAKSMSDDEAVEFVRESGISALMMWWDTRYTPGFCEKLNDAGAVVYVHSLNDPSQILDFREQAVGVYSNGYFPRTEETTQ